MTPQTSFQTASMAKFITAMAMLKAVQNGDFRLDENVNYRLDSWRVRIQVLNAFQESFLGLLRPCSAK